MPVASGQRITWWDLPEHLRRAVEEILGEVVTRTASQAGGLSPGSADRVMTGSGRRAFVKAVGAAQNSQTPGLHRREAAIAAQLPDSEHTPRLLGSFDDGNWVALVIDDVEGRHPATPWRPAELQTVLSSLSALSTLLTPTPVEEAPRARDDLASDFDGWERISADPPPDLDSWCAARLQSLAELAGYGLQALEGDTLIHTDLRADNLLIRPDGAVAFVDWPWATIGPAWLDVMFLLVNVNLFGGHDMDALVREHLAAVPRDVVTGVLSGFSGFFIDIARQPAPPGLPTVRAFQRDQGQAVLSWLKQRML